MKRVPNSLRSLLQSILSILVFVVGMPCLIAAQGDVPLQVYGEGILECAAYSPDGKWIATGSGAGFGVLWDVETGTVVRRFFGHTGGVTSVAFSPDGTKILTGSGDHTAKLWDVSSGEEVRTFSGHEGDVSCVAFSPDGLKVVTASEDETARSWDAETGKSILSFYGHNADVSCVAVSPDGTRVLTGGIDGKARLWDADTAEEIRIFSGHPHNVNSVAFSHDGNTILTVGWDSTAKLWNTLTGDIVQSFSGNNYALNLGAFSPDGKNVLTGGTGGTVKLWDVVTGKEIWIFNEKHNWSVSPMSALAYSASGTRFLTGSRDGVMKLWDANTFEDIRTFRGHTDEVASALFSPDGTRVLTGHPHFGAILWDAESGEETQTIIGHSFFLKCLAYSPSGTNILYGGYNNGTVILENIETQKSSVFTGIHTGHVLSVAFSPDGTRFVTGSADHTAVLWDIGTGDSLFTLSGHDGDVNSVAFSPDGTRILTGSEDHTAKLWDSKTGEDLRTFGHAWEESEKPIIIILAEKKHPKAFPDHAGSINSVAFSPDGTKVLTGSADNKAKLWDTNSGEGIYTFSGHRGGLGSVAYSADGTKVLTASRRGTVNVWDASTGGLLQTLHNKTALHSAAFSPDGTKILTGGYDGTARLWELDSPRVLIVAGGGDYPGNALIEQTKELAAYAYSICVARGYAKEDIRWLSAFDEEQDVDGDGISDIYGPANKKTLREAIEWAKSDLISPGRRFLIYMIDHGYPMEDWSGDTDTYFGINPRQTIPSAELDSWLDTLTTEDTKIDVTLVVDSCYSGKFIEKCTPPEGEKRLVISSTTADREAVMMPPPDLTSFSYVFWGAAYMGATMQEAVKAADGFFREFSSAGQRPQMDDNGDGVFNELDGNEMGQHRFGRSWAYAGHGTGEFPAFEEIHPSDEELLTVQPGASVDLSATIVPGSDPLEVWAVIRPPAPEIHAGEAVASDQTFERISLTQNGTTWTGKLENLTEEGVYIVSYTARFPYERLSRPKITRFRVSEKPNPEEVLTIRALLVAGGGEVRPFAQEMVSYALDVCQKRGYQNEDIRILGRDFPTTVDDFQDALSTLAVPESSDKKLRLFIYLTGDCSKEGEFIFDGNETISASGLISQLDQLQNEQPLLDVILAVDAPYAGKFIEANANSPSNRRVVIGGTSTEGKGVFAQGLSQMSFSKYFLGNAYQGKDLWTSYDGAYLSLVDHIGQAEPLLDDDGDGDTTKNDGLLAETWYVGRRGALAGPGAASLPTLLAVPEFDEPVSGDIEVWVDVLEAALPERIFVTIVPHSESGAALASFPEINLTRDEETWRWSGIIPADSFAQSGDYSLVFYALYADGKLSEPLTTAVVFDSGTRVTDWSLF